MASALPSTGLLRVVTPNQVTAYERDQAKQQVTAQDQANAQPELVGLAGHITTQFEIMRTHRNSNAGWNERLLHAQRVFKGEYNPSKLAEIKKFGGSDVFARVTSVKCRGASSLLREIYLGSNKPWGLDPTPEPSLPDNITDAIAQLVQVEVQKLSSVGQNVDLMQIKDRTNGLVDAALNAAKKKARKEADKAEDKLDDFLVEGGFYKGIAEVLVDLPLFPLAVIKGPVVRIVPTVTWVNGNITSVPKARMFWYRVSPFDFYFTPGVADIEDAAIIERTRLTRADLNDLLGLPGYNQEAIRGVLQDYGSGGLYDNWDSTDSERALNENRENPMWNRSGLINCLEFHGNVQGSMLLDYGMKADQIPDAERDYFVQAWLIGRYVIKVQIAPSPRKRHPYYATSFEKVPGTPVGNALPDILEDIQDVCNAALRSLVNNLSISSGPQVVVNDERLAPNENGDELYPWKRWHVNNDPLSNTSSVQKPIEFFQPNSNAQELLVVYEKFTQIADELSAIPRYITGSERMGGAGRTASGLAMLMGNASKILQTVAANIDRDIINPLLQSLYDMVMLTDQSGVFRGDEAIRVRGVDVAVQRETNRQRQIEFLTATANPFDMQIVGVKGRAAVLRSVAETIGLDGQEVVPTDEDLAAMQAGTQAMPGAVLTQQSNEGGGGPPMPGGMPPSPPAPVSQNLGVAEGAPMRGMSTTGPRGVG